MMKKLLAHPLTIGLDLDDPRLTELRQRVIRENKFLFQIYLSWYDRLIETIPLGDGVVLELGSGAGFLSEYVPELVTSEILYLGYMDIIMDGQKLPFRKASLKAIMMTNVLHHIPSVRLFLHSAEQAVRPGGVISMIEPWVSEWSKFIYVNFHHEPFDTNSGSWEFPVSGPLSGAHAAMPWIIFHRDRSVFELEFPAWRIASITPIMPFAYLLSGGTSMRPLMPGWSFRWVERFETFLTPAMSKLAMFAHIVLVRNH